MIIKLRSFDDGEMDYFTIRDLALNPTLALRNNIELFTNKTDVGDRDIWQGDILRNDTGRLGRVLWNKPNACWDILSLNAVGQVMYFNPKDWNKLTKVGSVQENPEIIKKGMPPFTGVKP